MATQAPCCAYRDVEFMDRSPRTGRNFRWRRTMPSDALGARPCCTNHPFSTAEYCYCCCTATATATANSSPGNSPQLDGHEQLLALALDQDGDALAGLRDELAQLVGRFHRVAVEREDQVAGLDARARRGAGDV